MKSAISSHSMEVITLVFFAHRNQILGGIFKRMCLDSANLYNEHKNGLFPLTESNCFLDILTIFQVLLIDTNVNDDSTTIKTEDGTSVK